MEIERKSEAKSKSLVLLSGGLDSATCAMLACRDVGAEHVLALTLFYGQKHAKEIEAAQKIVARLGIREHRMEQLPNIFTGGGSTLMDPDRPNPRTTYEALLQSEGVSPAYVPFRNANFLSVATAVALVHEADTIYFGAHAGDARRWAYPDCTPEFNGAMANAIYVGSYHKVRLVTPLQWMSKREVVALGRQIGTPFELTWSCYNGREKSCGECPTCVERLRAFAGNGWTDPLEYEREVR
ncbi:MAG: 7-cyano-7-deazaguanine synthase QueC [Peptococcaceae bacterium]|jgi:7-cyano-7-deazaguanine synthase|nr:7-cyano-7-deazaguanine synthase QueC [Peptococcaceae bacterium]